jgi:hypothetical protein
MKYIINKNVYKHMCDTRKHTHLCLYIYVCVCVCVCVCVWVSVCGGGVYVCVCARACGMSLCPQFLQSTLSPSQTSLKPVSCINDEKKSFMAHIEYMYLPN